MPADNVHPIGWFPREPGGFRSRHGDEGPSRHEGVSDDIPGPNDVPPICQRCDIPIYRGYTHINMVDCMIALKDYIKVYQDQLEADRMKSFEHPTRDELLHHLKTMAQQFDQLASYAETLAQYVRYVLRVTLLPNASQPTTYSDYRRNARYNLPQEGTHPPDLHLTVDEVNLDTGVIRELLQAHVPNPPQSLVQDQAQQERDQDHTGSESERSESVRPQVSPAEGLPNQG